MHIGMLKLPVNEFFNITEIITLEIIELADRLSKIKQHAVWFCRIHV